MTEADRDPVVTVNRTMTHGTCVRWYADVDGAVHQRVLLTASREGVAVGHGVYLTDIPAAWVQAATLAHKTLSADRGADMTHLATHRNRFAGGAGPLEPVRGETP